MTSTMNPVRAHTRAKTVSPAQRLHAAFAAVRVSFAWLGVRKTLTPDQKAQAADTFNAEGPYLSAAKKLLDTQHPAFKAVTAVKNRIVAHWRSSSLPYPEPGIRLIRQDAIGDFDDRMTRMRVELAGAVLELDRQYDELRTTAAERLGDLYNLADYPPSLSELFSVEWDFPSVEPPSYLLELNPSLYEAEKQRMAMRFEQAVELAETAFTEEFGKLVGHVTERLSGVSEDGRPKTFRDSAVTNLREFFERFRTLNIHSSKELDELVDTAQCALGGVGPQKLREDGDLRQRIATQFSAVASSLEGMMIDRPRRRVLRPNQAAGQSENEK